MLGWVAGDIMVKDTAVIGWLGADRAHRMEFWAAAAGALLVVATGYAVLKMRRPSAEVTDV